MTLALQREFLVDNIDDAVDDEADRARFDPAHHHLQALGTLRFADAGSLAALLRLPGGRLWQFRCRGGTLAVEESVWIDAEGRPRATMQLVVTGESPAGGANVSWAFKRAG